MTAARFGAVMSKGLKPNANLAIIEGSAKHTGHLIRQCTTCDQSYVANHYFAQHCQRSISDTQAAKEQRQAMAERARIRQLKQSNRPQ